ncbi:MAG: hypothetical protein AAF668_09650 [Pseudomonadota bacterium]
MIVSTPMLDAVLALIAVEFVLLGGYFAYRGLSHIFGFVATFLAAGACLFLALRVAVSGEYEAALPVFLIAAFGFHAWFLVILLRREA